MVTTGWLLVTGVAVLVGTVVWVSLGREAARRRRSADLEARDRKRWLMRRYSHLGPTGGGQHAARLPRCETCGDVLRDVDALQDHLRHEHARAA